MHELKYRLRAFALNASKNHRKIRQAGLAQ